MIVRVRTRDGLERVEVCDQATLGDLRAAIEASMGVALADQTLSLDQDLLRGDGGAERARVLSGDDASPLAGAGVSHGSVVYLLYGYERTVAAAAGATPRSTAFGAKMTVEDLVARQVVVQRQEEPACASLSLDRDAANVFQGYLHQMAFSGPRGGYMYGAVDEDGNVSVDAIYEPRQEAEHRTGDAPGGPGPSLDPDPAELERVDFLASALGLKRVGVVVAQPVREDPPAPAAGGGAEAEAEAEGAWQDWTVSSRELRLMAAEQSAGGDAFVTCVVSAEPDAQGSFEVAFEAFQCSKQCVKLWEDGLFAPLPAGAGEGEGAEGQAAAGGASGGGQGAGGAGGAGGARVDPGLTRMTKEVVVARKDTFEVDNDLFLVPVKILDHQASLRCTFPVENRVLPQGMHELREHLARGKAKGQPYVERLSDFHLLLFLSKHLDTSDMALLVDAVRTQQPVQDGYQLIIDAMCGV